VSDLRARNRVRRYRKRRRAPRSKHGRNNPYGMQVWTIGAVGLELLTSSVNGICNFCTHRNPQSLQDAGLSGEDEGTRTPNPLHYFPTVLRSMSALTLEAKIRIAGFCVPSPTLQKRSSPEADFCCRYGKFGRLLNDSARPTIIIKTSSRLM
jgi:hypothetical protein